VDYDWIDFRHSKRSARCGCPFATGRTFAAKDGIDWDPAPPSALPREDQAANSNPDGP